MNKKRFFQKLAVLSVCAAVTASSLPAFGEEVIFTEAEGASGEDAAAIADEEGITTNEIPGWPAGPSITSTSAVLLDDSSGLTLYAKNMDLPLDPGGTVKIMTALLALENSALTDEVTMTSTGVEGVTDGGLSISSQLGEIFTMEQCLYASMLASANDVALQVAEHIGGSVDAFVDMMNRRAEELGCTDTVFTNPTGLESPEQHSTAHDMALIMQAAVSNPAFIDIAGATNYTIPATNLSGGDRVLSNSFFLLDKNSPYWYESCLGGKKGFTQASGSTMVCAARRGDMTLVCALLQGVGDEVGSDAVSLLDYGFDEFRRVSLAEGDLDILTGGDLLLPSGVSVGSLRIEEQPDESVAADQLLRTYYFGDIPVGTAVVEPLQDSYGDLTAQGNARMDEARAFSDEKTDTPYYIIGAVGGALILLLLILMIKSIKKGSEH